MSHPQDGTEHTSALRFPPVEKQAPGQGGCQLQLECLIDSHNSVPMCFTALGSHFPSTISPIQTAPPRIWQLQNISPPAPILFPDSPSERQRILFPRSLHTGDSFRILDYSVFTQLPRLAACLKLYLLLKKPSFEGIFPLAPASRAQVEALITRIETAVRAANDKPLSAIEKERIHQFPRPRGELGDALPVIMLE